jgi:hypothetical protein
MGQINSNPLLSKEIFEVVINVTPLVSVDFTIHLLKVTRGDLRF